MTHVIEILSWVPVPKSWGEALTLWSESQRSGGRWDRDSQVNSAGWVDACKISNKCLAWFWQWLIRIHINIEHLFKENLTLSHINSYFQSLYCIRIRTRGGIYGQKYPSAWRSSRGQSPRELLKAEGYIWPYILSRVLTRTLYHFNYH